MSASDAIYEWECPECGCSSRETGRLATKRQVYCGLCAGDTGRDVRLNRWRPGKGPMATEREVCCYDGQAFHTGRAVVTRRGILWEEGHFCDLCHELIYSDEESVSATTEIACDGMCGTLNGREELCHAACFDERG